MWFYWVLLALTIPGALLGSERPADARRPFSFDLAWILVTIVMSLVIGLRFEVGGDWFRYLDHVEVAAFQTIAEALAWKDPGYQVVNWISARYGWGIIGTNLITGTVFSVGLGIFCRQCPRPGLALLVAVPYLVIVVGMGYTRQAAALGLVMIALVCLERGHLGRFAAWILVAALFHRSAVIMLPVATFGATRNRWLSVAWIATASFFGYSVFLEDSVDQLYYGYIEQEYQSQGALVRLGMNALPALLVLLWPRRFSNQVRSMRLWRSIAIISLVLFVVLFVSPSSTAVDRIGLYLIPLQLMVISAIPGAFRTRGSRGLEWTTLVIVYSVAVQYVWLNFASHADDWVPYRSFIVEPFN